MSIKKPSHTGKGRGSEESYSMPGTAKAMEIGKEQSEPEHTMSGGVKGSGDEGSSGMPGGGMSGGRGDEGSSGMPGRRYEQRQG